MKVNGATSTIYTRQTAAHFVDLRRIPSPYRNAPRPESTGSGGKAAKFVDVCGKYDIIILPRKGRKKYCTFGRRFGQTSERR